MKIDLLVTNIFVCVLFAFISCASQSNSIVPSTIFDKIDLPKGWSKVAANRPNVYTYKIKKDSGKTSIAITNSEALLFGTIDYSKYSNAGELLTQYSKDEIKKDFLSSESKDERATVSIESINNTEFGGLEALEIHSIYSIKHSDLKVYLIYYIIIGKNGWITIGLSSFDPKGYDDFIEMGAIIKKIDLTKTN